MMGAIEYSQLKSDSEADEGYERLPRRWTSRMSRTLLINSILFACSILFLAVSYTLRYMESSHCKADLFSGILPDSPKMDHYETRIFDDFPSSIYRQNSDEGEAAWNHLVKVNPFSIDEQTAKRFRMPQNVSRFPEHLGGGYVANLAVFHQLHCLKTVWQYTYFDYYKDRNHMFHQPADMVHKHIDHCVDMLRQALMCSPDTSVVPFMWTIHAKLPFPDYDTPRTCRNFDEILEWGRNHAAVWPGPDGFDRPEWHMQMFP